MKARLETMQSVQLMTTSSPKNTRSEVLFRELTASGPVREEQAERLALVGDVESLDSLAKEYEHGSQVFLLKIRDLEAKYASIRRARGDGNCFFRSFIFAYIENLVKSNDIQERERLVSCLESWNEKLTEGGFDPVVFEDHLQDLIGLLNTVGAEDALSIASLENTMRDEMPSNLIVMLLRILTSCELQRRKDFFLNFVLGYHDGVESVEQFCRKLVEPMGEESDHMHIVALTEALAVPLRVMYLDGHMNEAAGGMDGEGAASTNAIDFVPDECGSTNRVPRVHLLYRPGHYDILYPTPV
eukprot:jgi/Botrbrau1/17598/Bobra.0166s0037.3